MENETSIGCSGLKMLLERLDSDDKRAAEKYCHLLVCLTSFCEQRTHYSHYADDIVIKAIEIVTSKLRDGESIKNPYAYSFAVTRNLVSDLNKKPLPLYLDHASISAVKCNRQRTERDAIESEIGEECRQRCLDDLPLQQRNLILRYYQQGLHCKDHREDLAKELCVSAEALSNRVARIRKKLSRSCRSCIEKLKAERLPAILQNCS
ncbi:MAG TPA: sigma-70 family RNA polymerase sigma factor [Candidatus Dormibacteraeota bacterium]|jgi:RNA polymerase sigma factor (sigma-70 family)|nr:sigma-70 family RNA polymerase sigma factor [Candidatus Dormibacteraeota bacterium]